MNTSDKIKSLREQKRIKQIEIANKLNLDPAYYARLEKRGDKLTVEQLKQIASALEVSLDEILDIELPESNEVEGLKKRVLELQEALEDKRQIIKSKDAKINEIVDVVEDAILSEIRWLAYQAELFMIRLYTSETAVNYDIELTQDEWINSKLKKKYPFYKYYLSEENKAKIKDLNNERVLNTLCQIVSEIRGRKNFRVIDYMNLLDEFLEKYNNESELFKNVF